MQGGRRPDLTLLLDVPVEIGLERSRLRDAGRARDRFERRAHGILPAGSGRLPAPGARRSRGAWPSSMPRRRRRKSLRESRPCFDPAHGYPERRPPALAARIAAADARRAAGAAHAAIVPVAERAGPGRRTARALDGGARAVRFAAARPCGTCAACVLLRSGTHPDFHVVRIEEDAKQIKVDQIRDLIGALALKSYRRGYKVGIIEGAEMLNAAGANAFLKTLEEPAPGHLLILIARPAHRLPATIASRCLKMLLRAPPGRRRSRGCGRRAVPPSRTGMRRWRWRAGRRCWRRSSGRRPRRPSTRKCKRACGRSGPGRWTSRCWPRNGRSRTWG